MLNSYILYTQLLYILHTFTLHTTHTVGAKSMSPVDTELLFVILYT